MSKNKLSSDDRDTIKEFDDTWNAILETLKRAQQFKVGDYLILKTRNSPSEVWKVQENSYGAPIKFQVVHVNDLGVAFIKNTNKKGEPIGRIYSCCGTETDSYRQMHSEFQFELDPDFADALLLEDQYDPTSLHRSKKDIWKAVTAHNKACKIPTRELKDIATFFDAVNIGDTLWTSNTGSFFVQDKKVLLKKKWNEQIPHHWTLDTEVKGPNVTILTLLDKNGNTKEVPPDFFENKALYKERPRTYKELKI